MDCEKQRDEILNFYDEEVDVNREVFQCKFDGSFDDIQCFVVIGECWCVYYNNIEIFGL